MKIKNRLFAGLSAVCVTALPSIAHAQSSVTLYGVIDNGIAYSNSQTTLGSTSNGAHNVQLSPGIWEGSKFGMKGSEDLGGGLSAIFNLMSRFNSANGSAQFPGAMFAQQAWVGLQDKAYGSLTLGRQYMSYYWMTSSYSPTTWLTGFSGAHPGDLDNFDTDYKTNNTRIVYDANDRWINGQCFLRAWWYAGKSEYRFKLERRREVSDGSIRNWGRLRTLQQCYLGRGSMERKLHCHK